MFIDMFASIVNNKIFKNAFDPKVSTNLQNIKILCQNISISLDWYKRDIKCFQVG
jgi:hypothetical protein